VGTLGKRIRKGNRVIKSRVVATGRELGKLSRKLSKPIKSAKKKSTINRDSLGRFAAPAKKRAVKATPSKKRTTKRGGTNAPKRQSVDKNENKRREKKASGKKQTVSSKPKTSQKAAVVKKSAPKKTIKKTAKKVTRAKRETVKQTKQIGKSARAATKLIKAVGKSKKSRTTKPKTKKKTTKSHAKKRRGLSGGVGSGKKQTTPVVPPKKKAAQKSKAFKTPKKVKRFKATRPHAADRENFETNHLNVVRSYQVRSLPEESKRALFGTLEDMKRDAPRLQSLLKDGDYWGFRLNGGNSYQLFDTIGQLIARLSEYGVYRQFSKKRGKDYTDLFNTLELVVVHFNASIPPPVPNTRIQAQREWQANKVTDLKQRKQVRREEAKMRKREVTEAKRAAKKAVKARDKFEEKLSKAKAKAEKEHQLAVLAKARARAAETKLRELTKQKRKGGK
jgi:hypothetical protein